MSTLKNKKVFIDMVSGLPSLKLAATRSNYLHGFFCYIERMQGLRDIFKSENKEEVINLIKLSAGPNVEYVIEAYLDFMQPYEALELLGNKSITGEIRTTPWTPIQSRDNINNE